MPGITLWYCNNILWTKHRHHKILFDICFRIWLHISTACSHLLHFITRMAWRRRLAAETRSLVLKYTTNKNVWWPYFLYGRLHINLVFSCNTQCTSQLGSVLTLSVGCQVLTRDNVFLCATRRKRIKRVPWQSAIGTKQSASRWLRRTAVTCFILQCYQHSCCFLAAMLTMSSGRIH